MSTDKFQQPLSGIEIVSDPRSPGAVNIYLTPEDLDAARARIEAGDDPEKVATDLAALNVSLELGFLNGHDTEN